MQEMSDQSTDQRMNITAFRRFLADNNILSIHYAGGGAEEEFASWMFVVNPNIFRIQNAEKSVIFRRVTGFCIRKQDEKRFVVDILHHSTGLNHCESTITVYAA